MNAKASSKGKKKAVGSPGGTSGPAQERRARLRTSNAARTEGMPMKIAALEDRIEKAGQRIAALASSAAGLSDRQKASLTRALEGLSSALAEIRAAGEGLAGLASFPELNPEPVMETDQAGKVFYLNPAARDLFPDLERKGPAHAWLERIGDTASKLNATGKAPVLRELKIGDRWFEQEVVSVQGGRRLRVFGRDITERKLVEAALRESEQQYRNLVENVNSIIVRWNPDGKITFFNRFAQEFFGYAPDEILGQSAMVLVPETETMGRDLSHIVEDIVARPEAFRMFENENVLRDGKRVWVQWSNQALMDEAGDVREVLAVGNDITAKKRAEEALKKAHDELESRVEERTEELRKSELLLRSVLETLPIGVWITDKEGRIILGNPAGQEIWAGAKYVGIEKYGEYKGWWADTGKPIRADEWAVARAVTKGETSINEEVEIECFDGTHKFIFNSALPILDSRNEITGAIIINQDITRRREGETKRREQAVLLDLARDAILVRDPEMKITFWNSGARETYGWTGEEAMGQVAHTLLKTRFPDSPEEVQERLFAEGHWEGDLVRQRKDGGQIVVESRWAVLAGKDGKRPAAILEISRDITDRKQAQEALRSVSAYTRGLIEASLDPLVTISPEGKITDVNRATESVTGVPRNRLIASDFSDYFTEPEKARAGYREVFSTGSVRDYPLAIRHASGKVTEVLYNATIYKDEAGETVGVFAAARDVTALRAAEKERWRLATAVEQIADGVAIVDLEGRVLSANPAFGSHHSLPPQASIGRHLLEVLEVDREHREMSERMRESMDSGKVWNWHLTQRTRLGQVRELELTVSPIRDREGRTIHAIAVERDMTQEILFQEKIRQWQKMEALGTLAGGIAHDFNNILLPILINTELILAGESADSPVAHRLSQVYEAAQRGKEMVKQIITFSRQKEQMRLPVDIPPIIRESLKLLRVSIPKNIEITERIETGSALAVADTTQIHQVMMNLGSNAAYAMREKGGLLEVGLSEIALDEAAAARHFDLKSGPYLRLVVRDNGHGMTPEVKGRIFEPFFTTKGQGEGAGMGLPVVHGIVKSHGGAITVESEPGKGTTFTIYLPRVIGTPESLEDTPQPFPKGTERVLFVDDEDIQVRAMNKLLEHLGYRVVGLSDPRTALDVFRRQPGSFDLVITDQTMPHMAGIELVREVLRIRPGLPVILCTGYSETLNEEDALAAGVGAFVPKPFSVKEIAEAIRRVLSVRS
jgi:PAS domain S-box-containing protein